MCTKNELSEILSKVSDEVKNVLQNKLSSLILFGSYARNDFDAESDIDIMILADISSNDVNHYSREIRDKIYQIEIEKDCVLSLCIVPTEIFNRFKEISPFYQNVLKEGVQIAI